MEHVNDCDCLFIVRLQSFDPFSWRKDLLGRVRRESSWDFKVSDKCWLIRNQWFARIQRACKRVTSSRLMSFVSSTICGVVCSDGIITGTEKIIVNKMMVSGTDKRTYSITKEVGCVSNGCKEREQSFHNMLLLISNFNSWYRLSMDLCQMAELSCSEERKRPSSMKRCLELKSQAHP